MATVKSDKKLKKKIEKKILITFARTLDEAIDFEDAAWDELDATLDLTIGPKMDARLKAKKISLKDWWTKPQGNMTGEEYTARAIEKFAEILNALGSSAKITARQVADAYDEARIDTLKLFARATKDRTFKIFAPILCESPAVTAKRTVTKTPARKPAKPKKATRKRVAGSRR